MNERHCELTLALLTVLLGACVPETDSPVRAPVEPEAVAAELTEIDQLDDRLMSASRVEFEFVIDSEGSLISHFSGRVRWVRDGEFVVVAEGEFTGQPQQLELRGDASTLKTIVGGNERWSGARPPELVDALVVGLTRMGLLHNLAVLVGGMAPDHADGGAREWLEADEVELGEAETREDVVVRPLEFTLLVSQQPVSRATLWLDADGLPVERRQAVEFPEGEMRVTERYSNFVVEP